jgi:hypothetical protein
MVSLKDQQMLTQFRPEGTEPSADYLLQARFLPWSHISQEQLSAIRDGKLTPADAKLQHILLPAAEASSYNQGQQQILYELYGYALHQGQVRTGTPSAAAWQSQPCLNSCPACFVLQPQQ